MKIDPQILFNAIQQALREMRYCPDDDVSTIWNEQFEEWELPLKMDNNYEIETKTPQIN